MRTCGRAYGGTYRTFAKEGMGAISTEAAWIQVGGCLQQSTMHRTKAFVFDAVGTVEEVKEPMGFVLCMAPCIRCKKVFGFNPNRVPSIVIDGQREPICLDCVEFANPLRIANGLEPIVPLPGAYEGCSEDEI